MVMNHVRRVLFYPRLSFTWASFSLSSAYTDAQQGRHSQEWILTVTQHGESVRPTHAAGMFIRGPEDADVAPPTFTPKSMQGECSDRVHRQLSMEIQSSVGWLVGVRAMRDASGKPVRNETL